MDKKQSRLAKLRERAERLVEARTPILHYTNLDVEAVVEELRVHQLELDLQLEDLQQSYAALEIAQQRYRKLFDNAPIAYFVIDNDGYIVNANLATSQMVGVERDSMISRIFAEFVAPDFQDAFHFCWRAVRNERQAQACEIELQVKDGKRVPVLLNIEKPEDESSMIFLALTDLSTIKHTKEAFALRSKDSQEMSQLRLDSLNVIAPEFYRPLGTILSSVELLYKHGKRLSEKKKVQLYQSIRNLLWYLNDTVQDARNIQELERNKLLRLEAFELIGFTQQIINDMEVLANGRKIALEIESQDEKTTIIWNLNLYRRIVMNLLDSLLKSTNKAIRCQLDIRETTFSLRVDTHSSTFTEEELDLMFDAFFQGINSDFLRGRGNGLLLAYHTIQTHGGSIRYKSYGDKRISFMIELPKLQANPSPYRQ